VFVYTFIWKYVLTSTFLWYRMCTETQFSDNNAQYYTFAGMEVM